MNRLQRRQLKRSGVNVKVGEGVDDIPPSEDPTVEQRDEYEALKRLLPENVRLTPGQAVRFARLTDAIHRLELELAGFKMELGLNPETDYDMDEETGELRPRP